MRIKAAIHGDLARDLGLEANAVRRGSSRALRRVAYGLRNNIRGQLRRAFPASGMGGIVGASIRGDEALVASRWTKRRRSGRVDMLTLFSEGATISARPGRFLAVPTGNAPLVSHRGGSSRASPAQAEAMGRRLEYRRSRSSGGVLVLAGTRTVTHVLVRQVTLRPRISLERAEKRWLPRVAEILAQEIEKQPGPFR